MIANNYDIIFLALAKNVAKTINYFFQSVENLAKEGIKINVIIGENSSNDNTKNILQNIKSNSFNFNLLDTEFLKKYNNRIVRLGAGREYLKNYLVTNKFISKYICIIDLDDVVRNGFDTKEFILALEVLKKNIKTLFAVSSKSKPYYYDLLPLIIEDYYEFDVYSLQTKLSLNIYQNRKKYIYDFQKKITKMRDVDTISSHNGLSIYNYDDYLKGNYKVDIKHIKSEHISLNKSIYEITKKKIRMLNNLNVNTPPEHMPMEFKSFFKKNILKYLKISN